MSRDLDLEATLRHPRRPVGVSWSPCGGRLVTAGGEGRDAVVWDVREGTRRTLVSGASTCTAVAWSPDGGRVAVAFGGPRVVVADVRPGATAAAELPLGHTRQVWGLAWSPDGARLASVSRDGTARVWRARDGLVTSTRRRAGVAPRAAQLESVAWGEGGRVAVGTWGGEALVYRPCGEGGALALERALRVGDGIVGAVAFSPGGAHLAAATPARVRVWNRRLAAVSSPGGDGLRDVAGLSWSPDGERLAACACGAGATWAARVWRALSAVAPLDRRSPPCPAATAASFSPCGTRLATCHADGGARVWDAWDEPREEASLALDAALRRELPDRDAAALVAGFFSRGARCIVAAAPPARSPRMPRGGAIP